MVLKVFRETEENDKKGFYKEVEVIKAIMDYQHNHNDLALSKISDEFDSSVSAEMPLNTNETLTWMRGFPRILSFIDGNK